MSSAAQSAFAATLIAWHARHGRHHLPWQASHDPYRIWVSEIMLQQTQVEAVIPYYLRFMERFPNVASLAGAPVDEVLGVWSGLGYYARARNLHKAAQLIMLEHGGRFPQCAAGLVGLPGIGRSTAAAIAAFAFGERAAILDGNVKRVLCRMFGIEGYPGEKRIENQLWALAESLLPVENVGTYTQAQMDFGATLCTRSRPACSRCPMAQHCVALRSDRVGSLPTPRPTRIKTLRQARLALVCAGGQCLLEKRPESGIWGGLLSLPELLPDQDPASWTVTRFGLVPQAIKRLPPLRHAFTHFSLDIETLQLILPRLPASDNGNQVWLHPSQFSDAALPAPIRRILEDLDAAQQ